LAQVLLIRGLLQSEHMAMPSMKVRAFTVVMLLSYFGRGAMSQSDGAIHDNDNDKPANLDEVSDGALRSSRFVWIGVPGSEYLWGSHQCPLLVFKPAQTLESCKKSCSTSTRNCHAINYDHVTKNCELMGCTQPVVTPNTRKNPRSGWAAYFMHVTVGDLCHPGETLQSLDDGGFVCERGSPQVLQYKEARPDAFCWDEHLPPVTGCWPNMDKGSLKQFAWTIRLKDGWVSHYNQHRDDFARHGYRTLEASPRILLDKVSYLFEQQFSVRLVVGTVEVAGRPIGTSSGHPSTGIINFDTTGRANSGLGCLCNTNCEMLGCGMEPFNSAGEFHCQSAITLAHEMGHFFGSGHTPAYKPDIMVVDGRPSYRRCGGRSCMYYSFLPWDDSSSYGETICRSNIATAQCATLVPANEPLRDRWVLADAAEDCNSACAKNSLSCDEAELLKVDSPLEVQAAAQESQQQCQHSVGWAYDFSPSICTTADCCGSGSCTGWCTYGNTGKRSCMARTGGHHQRLCPCLKVTSGKYAIIPELQDHPIAAAGFHTVVLGAVALGLLGASAILLRRMRAPSQPTLAEEPTWKSRGDDRDSLLDSHACVAVA